MRSKSLVPTTLVLALHLDSGHSTLSTPGPVATGRWIHLACDWSQSTDVMRIFVDGRLRASGPIGGEPRYLDETTGLGNFGAGYSAGVSPFPGDLDDVRILNRVLTDAEVLEFSADFFADGFESGDLAGWSGSSML